LSSSDRLHHSVIAGCVLFFTLTQCGDRPPRYADRCASKPIPPTPAVTAVCSVSHQRQWIAGGLRSRSRTRRLPVGFSLISPAEFRMLVERIFSVGARAPRCTTPAGGPTSLASQRRGCSACRKAKTPPWEERGFLMEKRGLLDLAPHEYVYVGRRSFNR
jgi:hypothetical protein